jgi:hypothetical protein
MKAVRILRHGLVWMALGGMCLPAETARGGDADSQPTATEEIALAVSDIMLAQGGLLTGQVLDEQMCPMAGADVAVSANGRTVAATVTDDHGSFAVAGLRGGFHQITTARAVQNCRLWPAGTAPPRATYEVRLVEGTGVVRGQWCAPSMVNRFVRSAKVWATNPFVVGGVIAAAVAIPVALHNDHEGPSS